MRFYHGVVIFLIAIAIIIVSPIVLFSQTPKTTTNSVENSSYERIACSELGVNSDSEKEQNGVNPFPTDGEEGKDYECGYLTVPELHSQPQGKTIEVGIVIIKSTNSNPGEPLVMFQGGPGGSSVSIFASFASPKSEMGKRLRAERDLIVFDKRGNRYSNP